MSSLAPELHTLLNQQINEEMSASYSYLAMSAWFEDTPYGGFAHWMLAQSQEETLHAMKFYHFLIDRGAKIELAKIEAPILDYASPLEVFEKSLEQERHVTATIHTLYDAAEKHRDHESKNLLNWFLDEQVEEEKSVQDMIDRLRLVGDNPLGLLQLDQEASQRKPLVSAPSGQA
ncbi:MAG: ferritin [Verrucomicrobiales bacterium]|jgi:ferritin